MSRNFITRCAGLTALLFLISLCSGCSAMLNRSYLYEEQHDEQYQEDVETDSLTVDNYYGLRSAILSFVESGTENGVIRSYSYDGDDIEADLEQAAYEITRSDPLGAWAVDYMTHDCNRIVSYYEITISITFRRTAEEIAALEQVSSMSAARTRLIQAMEDCEDVLAMRLSYTSELDASEVLEEACLENPLLRLGSPSVSMSIYPDSGVQRILELTFTWEESAAVVTAMREQAQDVLDTLSRFVSESVSEESRMSIYFRRLCNRTSWDPDSDEDDIYAALVNCSSGSQGIAEAFCLLCTQNGLTCSLISGLKDGEPHWWNQVTLDGQVYHVDVTAALAAGSSVMTLCCDEDLYGVYSWDTSLYPASTRPAEEETETEEETEAEAETEMEEAEEEAEAEAPAEEGAPAEKTEPAGSTADSENSPAESAAADSQTAADSEDAAGTEASETDAAESTEGSEGAEDTAEEEEAADADTLPTEDTDRTAEGAEDTEMYGVA